ncbi:exonuclease SbcCD subunit D [Clostridium oryzae]|uniref:Nuclease SbcCD subunit D n=1 Tax=Clostridium oryzae TaxID=1450648 RepID=A0A1V4IKD4_9CLOT|nr:exonuclease SbcCD subunit D [Clostridium oryzae]OPJ60481.1 nuclease SbcCD subunit D [Clostridium oryzae]
MKFIHTGDWHIGKIINEFSMLEEQRFVLKQLVELIAAEKPDALLIAGDLYDRSIPPVEAVELIDDVFSKILLELKVPILVIGGNHDSGERISFCSSILTKNGLHIVGTLSKEIKKIQLKDEFGAVNFYMVPYSDPREAKSIFEDDSLTTHEQVMLKIIENIKQDIAFHGYDRNIMIAHGYVSNIKGSSSEDDSAEGPVTCDSERPLSIGGTDIIDASIFDAFNYTALGHLHGSQKIKSDKIRYSGSLLKYSFSEVKHKKSAAIVTLDNIGNVNVVLKELTPKRDMRIIKGPLKELLKPEVYSLGNTEDYIFAQLTDEGELVDPMQKLRSVYPNAMGLSREGQAAHSQSSTSASKGYKDKSKLELFCEFYKSVKGSDLSPEKLYIVTNIIEKVEKMVR